MGKRLVAAASVLAGLGCLLACGKESRDFKSGTADGAAGAAGGSAGVGGGSTGSGASDPGGGGGSAGDGGAGAAGGAGGVAGAGAGGSGLTAGTGGQGGGAGTGGITGCPAASHRCVGPAPPGWEGPVYWFNDAPSATPPNCNDGLDGYSGALTAPAATCPTCGCGAAEGGTCAVDDTVAARGYTSNDCTGGSTPIGAPVNGCYTLPLNDNDSIAPPPLVSSAGTCSAISSGTVDVPVWSFDARSAVCPAVSEGSCSGTDVCVRQPDAPYTAQICVYQPASGSESCPPTFPLEYDLHQGVTDTRGCSRCECGSATGQICSADVVAYTEADCAGITSTAAYDPACVPLSLNRVSYEIVTTVDDRGSCQETGGEPTGDAVPTGSLIVCCQ